MKRYKLLKDLPTFKAGEIFYINESGDLVLDIEQDCDIRGGWGITAYTSQALEKFPNILTDWFEEIPEEPKTVWDLDNGDEYWVITKSGGIDYYIWGNDVLDNGARGCGDCFLTEGEAEKELARRKAKVILERDTKGFKPNWNDGRAKWEVYYDYDLKGFYVYSCTKEVFHKDLLFATEDDARASIKAHEKEWKIYLGVEE